MNNIPNVKLGIVAGSTDWLPVALVEKKRQELMEKYTSVFGNDGVHECSICITDNEINVKRALKDIEKAGCNALCIYFGNYGPEHACTILAEQFDGPIMLCAAAEDDKSEMQETRKDSYSGFINACYALSLKKIKTFVPSKPVGTIQECVKMIHDFIPLARALLGVKGLKIISFGPRPASYFAAYAPNHSLYSIGVEIDEFSEMELLNSYQKHTSDRRIENTVLEMMDELKVSGENAEGILLKFAQYELTINDWIRGHKGNRKYVALTSTCWPAFPLNFGFVPCYVNSRLTGRGFPVACEVDVYGALSEYIGQCISGDNVTILNYNNNVPQDFYEENIKGRQFNGKTYVYSDVFIGYHCGVTCSSKLEDCSLKEHFVNNRLIGSEQSQGTIQGNLLPGKVTLFRIQGFSDGSLGAYVAEGQILPVHVDTYGGKGVLAVPEMERFYRNVLIERHYPNHFALIWGHYARELFCIAEQLGIRKLDYNHPANIPYLDENIWNCADKGWY